MKTLKKITLVALMLGTLIGYANEDKKDTENKAKRTVKVQFNNVKKGQTLTIKSEQGTSVYNSEIKNAGKYSKTFDISYLQDGIYTAELNKDFEIIVKTFYVKNGLVTFLKNEHEKVFKPVIRNNENLLYISKLDFSKDALKVTIYYNGHVIHSEMVEGEDHLNRVYRLSENEVGDYKVVINSDNRTFVKDITI